jgi:hypothetical protein
MDQDRLVISRRRFTQAGAASLILATGAFAWSAPARAAVPSVNAGGLFFDFAQGTLPDGVVYRRPGRRTVWGPDLQIATALSHEPRFDHDPETGFFAGLLCEPAVENLIGSGRNLSGPDWQVDGVAPRRDALGIDGRIGSASTLEALAQGGTCLTGAGRSRGDYTFSAWIRRQKGYGPVDVTVDGGRTWREVTAALLGGAWVRVEVGETLDQPRVGFRLGEAGDAVEIDACQLERGVHATSEILTEGVRAQVNADELIFAVGPDKRLWRFAWPAAAAGQPDRHLQSVGFTPLDERSFEVRVVTGRSAYASTVTL